MATGTISTDSGVLKQTQYSFSTRFENGISTNPEELLAAAHAGRFTMALSAQLGGASLSVQKLETTTTVTLDKVSDGFAMTKSHLNLVARIFPVLRPNSTPTSKPPKPAAIEVTVNAC